MRDAQVTEHMMRMQGILFRKQTHLPVYWHHIGSGVWSARVADMSSIRFVTAGCVPIASTSYTAAKEPHYA